MSDDRFTLVKMNIQEVGIMITDDPSTKSVLNQSPGLLQSYLSVSIFFS